MIVSAYLNALVGFGLVFYICTSSLCAYVGLVSKITDYASWENKLKVYFGWFNIILWSSVFVASLVLKIGGILLS